MQENIRNLGSFGEVNMTNRTFFTSSQSDTVQSCPRLRVAAS